MKEITLDELFALPCDDVLIVDIRDEGSVLYGMLPNAVNIPMTKLIDDTDRYVSELKNNKTVVFYCQRGENSKYVAETFEEKGINCYNLIGGYNAFLMAGILKDQNDTETRKRAEESIRKKFHKSIFSPFAKACKNYELI
nr:rhodanese-like domain-containing protein [Lachnospiraceae bacterium]